MDVGFLCRVLEGTLSADNGVRKAAENELTKLVAAPGYISTLLSLLQAPEVPVLGKTAAAVAFKNAITRNWHSDEPDTPSPFGADEKEAVRRALLPAAVAQRERPILNALCEAAKCVFTHDYPDRWPALPQALVGHLTSGGDPHAVAVAARLVREMTKVYEFKPTEGQGPATMLVAAVFPALAGLLGAILGGINAPEAGAVATLAVKAYYSAVHHSLEAHPSLHSGEGMTTWCGLLLRLLSKRLPQPGEAGEPAGMPVDPSARPAWPWWKARKWAAKTLAALADRWGQPKLLDADSPAQGAAALFNKGVAPQVTGAMLGQLAEWAGGGRYLTDAVLLHELRFLQAAVSFASCWKPLKPHLGGLVEGVVLRLFTLSPEEVDSWGTDPVEYLRNAADPFVSFSSPRNAAELLLSALLDARPRDTVPLLDALVTSALGAYAAAFGGGGGASPTAAGLDAAAVRALVLRKEAVLNIVQSVSTFYREDKARRRALEPMLTTHVLPELRSPHAQLRARACTVWACFADLPFKGAAHKGAVASATLGVLGLLKDADDVVRFTAAGSLRAFLEKSTEAQEALRPHVVPLLDVLFGLLDEVGLDETVATLQALVEVYSDAMPTLAAPILGKLVALWNGCLAEALAEAARDGGEPGDLVLEDDAALLAEGLLSSIVSLVGVLKAEDQGPVVLALAPQLWPFLGGLLNPDGGVTLEFLDSALAIVGDVVEAHGEAGALEGCDAAWALWARMLAVYRECALDYLECMDLAIEAYFAYGLRRLTAPGADPAHGRRNMDAWLDAVAHTEAVGDEDTRERMARLVLSLLHTATPTQALAHADLARIVSLYGRAIAGVPASSPTPAAAAGAAAGGEPADPRARTRKLRVAACNVIAQALCYNTPATLGALEAAGATGPVFAGWLAALPAHRRSLAAKISMLGLTCLLRQPLAALPDVVKAGIPSMLTGLVALQTAYEKGRVREAEARAAEEAEEDEFADDDEDDDDEGEAGDGGHKAGKASGRAKFVPAPDNDDDGDDGAAPAAGPSSGGGGKTPTGAHAGDDDDVIDPQEAMYAQRMAALRSAKKDKDGGENAEDAEDAADDEELWESPPPEETPLDHLNTLLHVQEALGALAGQPGAGALQAAVPPPVLAALQQMAAAAAAQRAKGATAGAFGPPPEEPAAAGAAAAAAAAGR